MLLNQKMFAIDGHMLVDVVVDTIYPGLNVDQIIPKITKYIK